MSDNNSGLSGDGSDEEKKRRIIRGRYRALISNIAERSTDLIEDKPLVLKELIERTDDLFTRVTHCREAALDAQCVSSIALLGRKKVSAVSATFDEFNIGEFTQKLIAQFHEDDEGNTGLTTGNWVQLGEGCQTFFKRSPSLHFMFGSFELEAKLPKPAMSQKTRPKDALKDVEPEVPKEKDGFGDEKENTSLAVDVVHNILKKMYREYKNAPICFMEFVVDPHSFSQTVENVFHTSFLIKWLLNVDNTTAFVHSMNSFVGFSGFGKYNSLDGYARIFLDDENLPVIEPVNSEDANVTDEANSTPHQMVMAWTMQRWREIVESYKITKAVIPPRPLKPLRS